MQIVGPPSQIYWFGWCGVWEFPFIAGFQVILLIQGSAALLSPAIQAFKGDQGIVQASPNFGDSLHQLSSSLCQRVREEEVPGCGFSSVFLKTLLFEVTGIGYVCVCVCVCVYVLVSQSCPAVCDPLGCSLPGSSVHRILQARIPEWVAIPFSRGSSQPRGLNLDSRIAGRFFTIWVKSWPQTFLPSVYMLTGPLCGEIAVLDLSYTTMSS